MTTTDAMDQLKALGTEQARKTYQRHGSGPEVFGVSWASLGKLKKQVKTDHTLAQELWITGNFDARIFATMVADPWTATDKLLETWVKDVYCYPLADALSNYVASTSAAAAKAAKWTQSKQEWIGATGWNVVASLALRDELSDDVLVAYLAAIEAGIHSSKNRVRHSMNSALIAIGTGHGKLRKAALAAAKRIGTVDVNHGDTGCKTPDATEYIHKVAARAKA